MSKDMFWTGSFDTLEDLQDDPGPRVRDLQHKDLAVVFQPIVEVRSGRAWAHEALVRCFVEEFANPLVLFEQAVAERACGRLGRMIRDTLFSSVDGQVFINIHPEELSSRWLVRPDDPLCFHRAGVFLEITESATFTHYELCTSILREVCFRTGAHLVIDDFGAGYSNLKRIVDLEPSIVKLDRELISRIDENRRKQMIVRHMVELCTELGAKVVAEGVERDEEFQAILDTGVHFVQGYLMGRPSHPPRQTDRRFRDTFYP